MLNRQRIVLALLDQAGEPIQNTTLVKLAFLLREETAIGRDRTFYDFVPYKQGPFSFGLYRELDALERDSYVERGERSIGLGSRARKLARDQIERLTPTHTEAVAAVVKEYGKSKRLANRVFRWALGWSSLWPPGGDPRWLPVDAVPRGRPSSVRASATG